MSDFRAAVRSESRNDSWQESEPHRAYPAYYRENLEEAFSACIFYIRKHHPDAVLRRVGSDLGRPLWSVE